MTSSGTNIIARARDLAAEAHAGRKRQWSEDDYFEHPRRVAERVAALGGTEDMVAAAYLHDVLEDTDVGEARVLIATNLNVLRMVEELTNASLGSKFRRAERKAMDRYKLAHASREAKLIKLVDRIDNLNDMAGAPEDFLRLYKGESLLLADAIGDVHPVLAAELRKLASA